MRQTKKEKIRIDDLLILISNLPNIFWYFAPGYIFIKIYTHVTYNDNDDNLNHILLRSMVVSFVIKTIFDFAVDSINIGNTVYSILLLFFTVMISYFTAIFFKSTSYDKIQTMLKINRTQNGNVWYDIFKKDAWVRIFLKDGVTTYLGKIEMLEENNREPIIVLSNYQLINIKGIVILDYSDNLKEKIILNVKDFERIEFTEI